MNKNQNSPDTPNALDSIAPIPKDMLDNLSKITKDPEIQAALARMHEMKEKCDRLLAAIYEKSGLTPQLIQKKLIDPKLTSQQRAELEESKKKLEKDLLAIFGKEVKLKSFESKESQDVKTRKGKTRGARNKWIPM